MKVSGFTFIRNAIKYDYPIVEAIQSILPICDEFVVAVGRSEDATLELIKSIQSAKIKIIETVWDDSLREGGRVLAEETNKAFAEVAKDADWAFYIQGDEAVHEKYLPTIKDAMQRYLSDTEVEGLLFHYLHFYGNYQYVADSRQWYRKEIRVIRNKKTISSYKDAQGFRQKGQKLNVKQIDAYIYHYGWVRNPAIQQVKVDNFQALWNTEEALEKILVEADAFDYSTVDSLAVFEGTHPKIMEARIKQMNWDFKFDISKKQFILRYKIMHWIESLTGWRIGEYKNYHLLR
ncbi:MAG: glycosyltransferase family 2 protein [Cytophagales bacterium]|nr:MAG: glycosyltransferase family 2 protein [Cytophagales bacterium]